MARGRIYHCPDCGKDTTVRAMVYKALMKKKDHDVKCIHCGSKNTYDKGHT